MQVVARMRQRLEWSRFLSASGTYRSRCRDDGRRFLSRQDTGWRFAWAHSRRVANDGARATGAEIRRWYFVMVELVRRAEGYGVGCPREDG